MSASSTSESSFVSDPSTSWSRLSAVSRRLVVAPTVARVWPIASRFVSIALMSVVRSVFRAATVPLFRWSERSQDIEQLPVGGGLAVAEQALAHDVHLHRDAGADLA